MLAEIEAVLTDRLVSRPSGSYSLRLLTEPEAAQRKIVEEAFELCLELGRAGREDFAPDRVAAEAADLLFHVLAGLVGAGVPLEEVLGELERRRRAGAEREAAP